MNLDSIINLNKQEETNRIECVLINQPAILAYFVIVILAIIIFGVKTDFFFLNEEMVATFYLVVMSAMIILFPMLVFKVKVSLRFTNGKPKITAKGLVSRKLYVWPFKYDMNSGFSILKSEDSRQSGVTYDKVVIYDNKKSLVMFDNVMNTIELEGKTISASSYNYFKLKTFGKHTGKAMEIYWALENFEVRTQEKNPKSESSNNFSPFVG
jgi:hypothetical protein